MIFTLSESTSQKIDKLILDIDEDYDYIFRYITFIQEHIYLVVEKFGNKVESMAIQRSTNGHMHIVVKLQEPVSDILALHMILACGANIRFVLTNYSKLLILGHTNLKIFHIKRRKPKNLKAGMQNNPAGEKNEQ